MDFCFKPHQNRFINDQNIEKAFQTLTVWDDQLRWWSQYNSWKAYTTQLSSALKVHHFEIHQKLWFDASVWQARHSSPGQWEDMPPAHRMPHQF